MLVLLLARYPRPLGGESQHCPLLAQAQLFDNPIAANMLVIEIVDDPVLRPPDAAVWAHTHNLTAYPMLRLGTRNVTLG